MNPSSHILKFETLPRVCFAEFVAGDMARWIGLPVVETEFLRADEPEAMPYLRILRYDRAPDASRRLRRLHQEDLIQALGMPGLLKYQADGGPSVRDVAQVLRDYTARPIDALERLRDWQIFNYLIGNWDGHARNLALLYEPDQPVPVLAPFYDLVAIEFFNLIRPGDWARDMALFIGRHRIPEQITKEDWEVFASDLGMPPKRLLARLEQLANERPGQVRRARQGFAEHFGDEPVYDYLEESVRRRCHWTLGSVFTGGGKPS
jgi:serine/threonine-protein kinase HipA